MPEVHLRQPGFTYSASEPFNEHCESIQKFKQARNLNYIYKNKLDKKYFSYDTAYAKGKNLAKRIVLNKILKDTAYEIALNPKYDGNQRGLASTVDKTLDQKISSEAMVNVNEVLAWESHKPVFKKFKMKKVYSRLKDNFWAADLAKMGSFSFKNWSV